MRYLSNFPKLNSKISIKKIHYIFIGQFLEVKIGILYLREG